LGFVFVHDIDPVADAFGVAEIDGFADVEAKAVGRNEARSEFAGVEADVDFGIDAVEVVEHEHLAVIFGHGHVGIFGLNEVDAYDTRIDGGYFEGLEGLSEDPLRRESAENLIEEADFDGAGGSCGGLSAVFDLVASVESIVEFLAIDGNLIAEACGEKSVTETAEVLTCGSGGVAGAI
jgi:hypothetical protein